MNEIIKIVDSRGLCLGYRVGDAGSTAQKTVPGQKRRKVLDGEIRFLGLKVSDGISCPHCGAPESFAVPTMVETIDYGPRSVFRCMGNDCREIFASNSARLHYY